MLTLKSLSPRHCSGHPHSQECVLHQGRCVCQLSAALLTVSAQPSPRYQPAHYLYLSPQPRTEDSLLSSRPRYILSQPRLCSSSSRAVWRVGKFLLQFLLSSAELSSRHQRVQQPAHCAALARHGRGQPRHAAVRGDITRILGFYIVHNLGSFLTKHDLIHR